MRYAVAFVTALLLSLSLLSCGGAQPEVHVTPAEGADAEPAKPGRELQEPIPAQERPIPRDALGRIDVDVLEVDAYSEFWRYFATHPEFGIDPDEIVLHAPRRLQMPSGTRTIYFDREFADIPVLLRDDEQLSLTFDPSTGIVTELHNTWVPIERDGFSEPRIQSGTAVQTALGPSMMSQSQYEDAQLAWRRAPDGGLELVWSVTFFSSDDGAGAEVLVDAMTGEVLGVRRWEE